jgi:hypothetical protein|tara:strand:+ start:621 stop:848 length:228 start_codon:yes stop_codon:yes gene_type:complete
VPGKTEEKMGGRENLAARLSTTAISGPRISIARPSHRPVVELVETASGSNGDNPGVQALRDAALQIFNAPPAQAA